MIHGWCTRCKRFKRVRVNWTVTAIAGGKIMHGVCHECST